MKKFEYYYSKTTNSFYDFGLFDRYTAAGTWPDDAVGVDLDTFNEFTGQPPDGKQRAASDDGMPVWVDIPPLTAEEIIGLAERQKLSLIDAANAYMNNKQWPGKAAIGRLKGDELAQYNLWLDYLDALDVLDTSTAPDITWPEKPQ